jgi:hypothetical protein
MTEDLTERNFVLLLLLLFYSEYHAEATEVASLPKHRCE